jgi:hypothetical protein
MSGAGDLSSLEVRLTTRFSGLDPEDVRRCIDDSVAQFEGARIRSYLAVLIERSAIDRLRVLESGMGEVGASYGADSRLVTSAPQRREMSRERDDDRAVRARVRVVPVAVVGS